MTIGKDKTRIYVTVTKELAKKIEEIALHEKTSLSYVMANLVEKQLKGSV